jgi:two-component system OmpR family response regulator
MSKPAAFIVDDDPQLRLLFTEALEEAGFAVTAISDGAAALSQLAITIPKVVVLDLNMPGRIQGQDILQHIRADPRLVKIKVMVASSDVRRAETLRGQADLVLMKPIGFSQLRDLAARLGRTELREG